MSNIREIVGYFSKRIQKELDTALSKATSQEGMILLEEIRIRTGKPIILKYTNQEQVLENVLPLQEEILETLQAICNNSIYSYQNQICNGFVTLKGGHRVGITGSVVLVDGKVTNINYVSSLNFRIAKQMVGVSNRILKYVLNIEENTVYNTLIISPPGARENYLTSRLDSKN
ncbi:MAG: hypothetical protein HFJ27_04400 [Clostridia bacterium]|nr:hypothetical protein [Clostridia bacterium]